MKSMEPYIAEESEYYVYAPSLLAKEVFYYVICAGHFLYEPGYHLEREAYDSYLLLYVEEGELTVVANGQEKTATQGNFVFLNCYEPHSYYTEHKNGCRCLWCHFDGIGAKGYYEAVTARLSTVFSLRKEYPMVFKLKEIYEMLSPGGAVKEPLVAKYITDILTAFLLSNAEGEQMQNTVAEQTMSYIKEHFKEEISTGVLAKRLGLSSFHFIRTFKKEAGLTPHEYLVQTRLDMAKYLLKNTQMPVKDICFTTGFSCESVFCTAFKRKVGMTPAGYRKSN